MVLGALLALAAALFDPVGACSTAGRRRMGLLPSLPELCCTLPGRPLPSPELLGLLPLGLVLLLSAFELVLVLVVAVVVIVVIEVDAVSAAELCALVDGGAAVSRARLLLMAGARGLLLLYGAFLLCCSF